MNWSYISFFIVLISCQLALAQSSQSAADTLKIKKVKSELKKAANDSIMERVKIPLLDTAEVITKAQQTLRDSMANHMTLPVVSLDSSTITDKAKSQVIKQVERKTNQTLPQKLDSSSLSNEAKNKGNGELKKYADVQVGDIPTDSVAVKQIKEKAADRTETEAKNTKEYEALKEGVTETEIDEFDEVKREVENRQEQLKQQASRRAIKQKMASKAKDYLANNFQQIRDVQSEMGELKKKYSEVPNSNDLSTAKKRTSLKGESFWKRLVIGGNFNLSKTNPVTIDLAPVLGWKLNKLFEVGATGAFRTRFGAERGSINTFEDEDVYGYSVFANHMVFRNFFGYLEGENMSKVTGATESNSRQWHQTLLVGIGRKFNVARFLEMQAIVAYNFLHDNQTGLYGSPVIFKTGFRIKK